MMCSISDTIQKYWSVRHSSGITLLLTYTLLSSGEHDSGTHKPQ